jgi:hypothetical protein
VPVASQTSGDKTVRYSKWGINSNALLPGHFMTQTSDISVSSQSGKSSLSRRWVILAIIVLLLGVEFTLQIGSGVYQAERGVYSDEATHFTTGILIRDYVRQGLGQSPLHFAEQFYLSFPKIAPFVWPPLLHLVLGAVMLLPFHPQTIALVVIGLVTAWVAVRVCLIVAAEYGIWAGLPVGLVYLGVRTVQDSSTVVMADIVVAAMALEAAYFLSRYWTTLRFRDAIWFGIFTGLACFAKGNGLAVILMPVLLLLLTWKWSVLKQKGIYWAAAIVAVVAGPLMVLSWYLYDVNSAFHPVNWDRVQRFATGYLTLFSSEVSWPWAVLSLLGAVVIVFWNRKPIWLALFSLWFATWFFHSTTSQGTGVEPRYVLLGFAPFLLLAPPAIEWLAQRIPGLLRPAWIVPSTLAVLAVLFFSLTFSWLHRRPMGYRAAAAMLHKQVQPDELIMVTSDGSGEGAFVSEFAAMNPRPRINILRGSKMIADQDWMGNRLKIRYETPQQALTDFEQMKITYFIVDETPEMQKLPYVDLAAKIATVHSGRVERIASYREGTDRAVSVYRLSHLSQGPRKPYRIDLKYSLGKTLER